jgi:hypothetical protein
VAPATRRRPVTSPAPGNWRRAGASRCAGRAPHSWPRGHRDRPRGRGRVCPTGAVSGTLPASRAWLLRRASGTLRARRSRSSWSPAAGPIGSKRPTPALDARTPGLGLGCQMAPVHSEYRSSAACGRSRRLRRCAAARQSEAPAHLRPRCGARVHSGAAGPVRTAQRLGLNARAGSPDLGCRDRREAEQRRASVRPPPWS